MRPSPGIIPARPGGSSAALGLTPCSRRVGRDYRFATLPARAAGAGREQREETHEPSSIEFQGRTSRVRRTGVAAAAGALGAPFIGNAQNATTTTWKVQTSWPAGVGLATFKAWAGTVKEKTGGELEIKPFAAKEVVGDFELLDGVKNGVLEAMNSFTLYWAGQAAGDGVPRART